MLLRSFILVSKVWNVKTVCRSLFSFVSAVHSVKILSLRLNYSRQRKETPQSFNLYIYKRSCGIRGKIDHNVLYHTIGLSQFLRSFNFDDTWEVCFLKEVRFLLFHLLSHGSFRRKGITGHSKALNNLWW